MRILSFLLALAFSAAAFAGDVEPANFHHVHLNVTNPAETIDFYTRNFSAISIKYANRVEALFTERSFILLNKVDSPPPSALESGIWHIGWGGKDVPNEAKWLKSQGVRVHTPIYKLGSGYVTYWFGPDEEVIEVNTMGHRRFGHVHLFAEDVNETTDWYAKHLGLTPRREHVPKPDLTEVRAWSNAFRCDNISFIVYGRPDYTPAPPWWRWEPLTEFKPTEGRAIDHIAFSYRDIEPVYARMKAAGAEIVEPIGHRPDYNHESFFVLAPDKVLVEIVKAKPIPEGIWDN